MNEKINQLREIVKEAVSEVLSEVLVAPVDKDPEQMTPDEKKQTMQKVQQSAGISDPEEPIDMIKKEQKTRLREMPRTPILYKLAPNWELKFEEAPVSSSNQKWYSSEARLKWLRGIIDYLKENPEGADITRIAKEKFNVPQPMLADYARELIKHGVLVPAGRRGQEMSDDEVAGIKPQFMRNQDPDEEEPAKYLGKIHDPEDLFIGGQFGDDFGTEDPETGERTGGDSIQYSYDSHEEPEDDEIEKTTSTSKLSPEQMDTLMDFDDLVRKIGTVRGNLKKNPKLFKGGLGEISSDKKDEVHSQRNLIDLYHRLKEQLKNLLNDPQNYKLIQKYRGDLKQYFKVKDMSDVEDEVNDLAVDDQDSSVPMDEIDRMQKLAGINKNI
jgi:hypothetical protein